MVQKRLVTLKSVQFVMFIRYILSSVLGMLRFQIKILSSGRYSMVVVIKENLLDCQ